VKKREVVFGERMQDFRQIVEEEEAVIESLWRQWEGIQIETVCLAFEVLGSNGVILKEEDRSVIAPEKIDGAIRCYTQHQDALRNTLDKMTAMEGSAKNVTVQTMKTLRAQQKVKISSPPSGFSNFSCFHRSCLRQVKPPWPRWSKCSKS
jgi:hypothetical protein